MKLTTNTEHVPYPAFYDGMKFILTDNKGK